MDRESEVILKRIWKHSQIRGNVWMPEISDIGRDNQRFNEGKALSSRSLSLPKINHTKDSYFTPGVSLDSRKARDYPSQRVMWVDCDEGYNKEALEKLMPTFMWETSPGHRQAVWLTKDEIAASEFHRDGFLGLIAQVVGGDKSGVDIGQLLRVPGSTHNKKEPYKGNILQSRGPIQSTGQLLTRVAKLLGFKPGLASDIGAEDPYGDRSKKLWQFERNASELGIPEDLTFKILKACKWNKWREDPERLKEDIAKAYSYEVHRDSDDGQVEDDSKEIESWNLSSVGEFGSIIRKPLRWVVPGIIPESGCGLLVASPKVGKTRVAIELALGTATGKNPLGLKIKRALKVGFFSLEDGEYLFSKRLDESLNRDLGRYKYHWEGHITPDLEWYPPKKMPLFSMFNSVDLSQEEDKSRLLETILEYGLNFVIIDTLSMAIGKADVSSSTDMYAILKDIKAIAKATKCSILMIHHTRKRAFEKGESIQEKVLGSTALHAWSDFVISLAPPEEDSDLLRMGVQTKMSTESYLVTQTLKVLPKVSSEDET